MALAEDHPEAQRLEDLADAAQPPRPRLPGADGLHPRHRRGDWDPVSTPSLVFCKAGHGGVNHTHPDAGQVEIHGHGQRLIVDLAGPGGRWCVPRG